MPTMHATLIRLSKAELDYLRREALRQDRSVTWLVRKAIREMQQAEARRDNTWSGFFTAPDILGPASDPEQN